MICKLCQLEKPLIRALLIPRNYFLQMKGKSKHLVEFETGESPQKSLNQSGTIDTTILCQNCDNKRLGRFENYGYAVFPPLPDPTKITRLPYLEIYRLGAINGRSLNLFLIGLLWKLHASNQALGYHVDLGQRYSEQFRAAILAGRDSKSVSCVAFLMQYPQYSDLMLGALRKKVEGVNCYVFYLPPWKLLIRVDNREFGQALTKFELRDGRDGIARVLRDFAPSERHILKFIQDQARSRAGLPRF